MPEGVQNAGIEAHRSARWFPIEPQNAGVTGELKPAFEALPKVMAACVGCEAAYRLRKATRNMDTCQGRAPALHSRPSSSWTCQPHLPLLLQPLSPANDPAAWRLRPPKVAELQFLSCAATRPAPGQGKIPR